MKESLLKFWGLVKPEPMYVRLVQNLMFVYLLYTISRILFFVFQLNYFDRVSLYDFLGYMFYGALYFDTVAIFYTNVLGMFLLTIPFQFRYKVWYQRMVLIIFILFNIVGTIPNLLDIVYYEFIKKRINISFTSEIQYDNLLPVATNFLLDYWYVLLACIIFVISIIYFYHYKRRGVLVKTNFIFFSPSTYYIKTSLYFIGSILIFVIGVRGGVKTSTRPITMSNAGAFAKETKDQNIILNSTFCILKTWGLQELPDVNYFSNIDSLNAVFKPVYIPDNPQAPMKKHNVVVIILESFGKEVCGYFTPSAAEKKITPCLDSLCKHGLVFANSYSNTRQSIDALPAILFGLPRLNEPFVTMTYYRNAMEGLPSLLKKEGYETSFFHGSSYGAMGFWALLKVNGVDKYYSQVEYGNDKDYNGVWGINDDPFLQFTAHKLKEEKQPFFSTIFTLSSHHPHHIPKGYTPPIDPSIDNRLKCVRYADDALKHFFQTVAKEDWAKNTLFVITGDHCQTHPIEPTYKTSRGLYKVPIVFYTPGGQIAPRVSEQVIQHIDITPTVMGMLNYDKPFFTLGKNINKGDSTHFTVNFINGNYLYIDRTYSMEFNPTAIKTVSLYNNITDDLCKKNLVSPQYVDVISRNERKLKAFIQQTTKALRQNKMLYPKINR